jgi:hypothetical protein
VDPQTQADVAAIELAAAEAHATGARLDALAAEMRARAIQAERRSS